MPVTPERSGHVWKIPLLAGQERQIIEVVFRNDAANDSFAGRVVLVTPTLTAPKMAVGRVSIPAPFNRIQAEYFEEPDFQNPARVSKIVDRVRAIVGAEKPATHSRPGLIFGVGPR